MGKTQTVNHDAGLRNPQTTDTLILENNWSKIAATALVFLNITYEELAEALRVPSVTELKEYLEVDHNKLTDTQKITLLTMAGVDPRTAIGSIVAPALYHMAAHKSIDQVYKHFANQTRKAINDMVGDTSWKAYIIPPYDSNGNGSCAAYVSIMRHPRTVKVRWGMEYSYSRRALLRGTAGLSATDKERLAEEEAAVLEYTNRVVATDFKTKVREHLKKAKQTGRLMGISRAGSLKLTSDIRRAEQEDLHQSGRTGSVERLPLHYGQELFEYIFGELNELAKNIPHSRLSGHETLLAQQTSAKYQAMLNDANKPKG